jgi:hypothetical protein
LADGTIIVIMFVNSDQGRIQEIQKEGAGTVSAKTLILTCGKSMKYKWTITKNVMILLTSQNFI